MKDLKIAYIGGGSRGWAWKLMGDLAVEPAIGGRVALYDIDHAAARHNAGIGNALSALPGAVGKWAYTTAETLKEALAGADFVICSILPGAFAEMRGDVHLPERHGIYQAVGDTAGPGGIVRALRTIPMFAEIARAVAEYCPKAMVVNYTNPMALCVKALYHVFPEIRAFGCCHEVFNTQAMLAGIFAEHTGEAATRQDIETNVVGVNHFTWFTAAACKGRDLFPIYRDYVEKHAAEGYQSPKREPYPVFESLNRVKFDLFLKYGYIAAAGDRHLAEFMPGERYMKDGGHAKSWGYVLTSVGWREWELGERLARAKRLAAGEEAIALTPSGEEGVLLIKALAGLGRFVSNVNLPNIGQIGNAPMGAVVETNAAFEYQNIRPVYAGDMPEEILKLTRPHLDGHQLTLEAAMEVDFGKALAAFKIDPLVQGRVTDAEAEALLRDMIRNTLKYLPEGWQALTA